ncbi:hypothetical protein MNBD_GAMMA21-1423 [hydrothermal vent metagenome]|uniref:Uncharacterized protein n=1 Tax=hydrothermal vent metagenome TaxID=652676 RepID=A0A3B0ZU29_9ZZZZ
MKYITFLTTIMVTLFFMNSPSFAHGSTVALLNFDPTTQGPLWPPSALVDENGDYVLVGNVLSEISPGVSVPIPGQAVLVSRDTVPPLDNSGKEDFSNLFAAPYKIVRRLDLRPGSEDLDIILHANSFGPPQGEFGGGPRVPMLGESRYNLNGTALKGYYCRSMFPSESQRFVYKRAGFALNQVPIAGFQGDQVDYDVNTGERFTPRLKNGANCPAEGCLGEDNIHIRNTKPVTLEQWLAAKVNAKVMLTDYDSVAGGYTGASFTVHAEHLLPNSIYIIVAVRRAVFEPRPNLKAPDPVAMNSILLTDANGRGKVTFSARHPFPDPIADDAGLRIIGLALTYKSDQSISVACPAILGPGVDVHAAAGTLSNAAANESLARLITVPSSE